MKAVGILPTRRARRRDLLACAYAQAGPAQAEQDESGRDTKGSDTTTDHADALGSAVRVSADVPWRGAEPGYPSP